MNIMPFLPDSKEIKSIRRKLNLTQKILERDLIIPQATISRIESGKGNPSYMQVKKIFDYLERKSLNIKDSEKTAENIMTREIILISARATIKEAIELMNKNGVSQIPIFEKNQNIGSLTAKKIQKIIAENPELIKAEVDIIKELPFPEIEKNWNIKDISNLLTNYSAVLVKERDNCIGIITDADIFKIM